MADPVHAAVEAAARAMLRGAMRQFEPAGDPWESMSQHTRCYWLDRAREAVEAGLTAATPLIRAEKAEAWDQGYAASDHEAYHFNTHGRTDNPYLAASTGEDNRG